MLADNALLVWHVAAGLSAAAVAFLGWRLGRKWGVFGTILFLVLFGIFCPIRGRHIVRPDGAFIAEVLAAMTLILLALAIQLALGDDVRPRRSASDITTRKVRASRESSEPPAPFALDEPRKVRESNP